MDIVIGLLSGNKELIDGFERNCSNYSVKVYKSIENTRQDNLSLLAIDANYFDDIGSVQFYLSKIRKKLKSLPVLLILMVEELETVDIEWFFDDLVLYPFRKSELMTRIKRLLLDKNIIDDENVISIGRLKINLIEYSVYLDNDKLDFTYKEFELLRFMVQNQGVVFSRKELLNKIWGVDYIGGTRTVDVHIRRLRGKLGNDFNTIIETVRNVGYRCMSINKAV